MAGCATTESASDESDGAAEAPARSPGPNLAATDPAIRTIQLYPGNTERALPVVTLNSSETLTLEFDLMAQQGRQLSVYFEHADRTWRRDLSPARTLTGFTYDALLDYRRSRGTRVPYVHYTYTFPNRDINFRVSGNYILRVTESGNPDAVLFERVFFLAESKGSLSLGADPVVVTGQRQPSIRPLAQFTPPSDLQGTSFGYTTCFVRNGRLPESRCEDRPRLAAAPELAFELPRSQAFAPTTADYLLDLSRLAAGGEIERVDLTTEPPEVLLEPDIAKFAGSALNPSLNGQIEVRNAIRGRAEPHLTAEYARTTFVFVPPNRQRLQGDIAVAGSFTGMQYDPRLRMSWNPERGAYEGDVLLKQGRYTYYYDAADPRLQTALRQNLPRTRNLYTAFVYYEDLSENTDRLLRVGSFER